LTVTTLENIGKELGSVLKEAAKKNEKFVAGELTRFPDKLKTAAIAYYPETGLKRRSGNLIRSIKGFFRKDGTDSYTIGLVAGGEVAKYARIQHEGGTTRPHIIRPRVAKALRWYGGGRTKGGKVSKAKGNVFFAKSVNHPGSHIKAKRYLIVPLVDKTKQLIKDLLKGIGL